MYAVIYNGTPVKCSAATSARQYAGRTQSRLAGKLRVAKWPAVGVGCIITWLARINGNYVNDDACE